ncbi:MAG: cyclic nucleotide-binding domain-containing protein, partial [Ardenticatenaceae bacterium]
MMESTFEKLSKQPLLDVLYEEDLAEILPLAHPGTFERDEVVFREGEEARNFYLITDGQFEVRREEADGEHRINLLYPGEFFGDIALLHDVPRAATVRAVDDSEVLYFTKEAFFRLLDTYPILDRRLELLGAEIERRTLQG